MSAEARAGRIAAVAAIQAIAAAFFLYDVVADVRSEGIGPHLAIESLVALALVAGVALGIREVRRLLREARARNDALAVAQGALWRLAKQRFADWGLTPAERDVALFALKGLEPAEIARLRGAAAGTVRAQLARVYAKAGVSSRHGLVGLFTEELFAGGIDDAEGQ